MPTLRIGFLSRGYYEEHEKNVKSLLAEGGFKEGSYQVLESYPPLFLVRGKGKVVNEDTYARLRQVPGIKLSYDE